MECCLIDRESHLLESVLNEIKFDSSIEHTEFKNKLTICLEELKLLHTEISAIQLLHDSDGCNYEDSLELLVMTLEAENKANSFIIMAQDFEISRYKLAHELSRVRAKFSHRVGDIQKSMIKYKSDKVENYQKEIVVLQDHANQLEVLQDEAAAMIFDQHDQIKKYQKGIKSIKEKNKPINERWAKANEYFLEEIEKSKTLKQARLNAAKKAGIYVNERQLTKMLPDPHK